MTTLACKDQPGALSAGPSCIAKLQCSITLRAHRLLSHVYNCPLARHNVVTIPLVISSCNATASTHTLPHFFFEAGKYVDALSLDFTKGLTLSRTSSHGTQIRWSTAFADL